MLNKLKHDPKVLLSFSIALAIITIASASLVSRSSRQAFVPTRSSASAFPSPCTDSFTVSSTGGNHVNFRLRLQDINTDTPLRRQQRQVRITLKPANGGAPIIQVRPINLTTADAVYEGNIDTSSVPAGYYDIYVKGFAHYQKKVTTVTQALPPLRNITLDWTATPLRSGDIFCGIGPTPGSPCTDNIFFDNYVEASDLAKAIQEYKLNIPTTSIADINLDGYVEVSDLARILINYGFNVPGDQ